LAGEILVIAEHKDGTARSASLQTLTAGAGLAAALGGTVTAVACGKDAAAVAPALARHGAARVVTIDVDARDAAAVAASVAAVCKSASPAAVLLAHTLRGKDLGPRLAALLSAPMASDCVEVRAEGGTNVARRPVYAGKAMVTVAPAQGPFVVSLRPNALAAQERPAPGAVQAAPPAAPGPGLSAVLKEVLATASKKLELTEAGIIVSGGRGLKGPENFAMIEELAAALGAAVGASRAVVDAGWRPHSDQVGQTGKTVSPQLYFAIGISGAIQHLAGMRTSKYIVAINKDPEAPIFKVADYGIVGDAFEVVPKLTAAVKALKAGG